MNRGSFKDNFTTALLANVGGQINAEGANLIGDNGQVLGIPGKKSPSVRRVVVRPDWCLGTLCSVEVKNYNIAKNQNGLINNVSKQAIERQANLPVGMKQEVIIDIRGQAVTEDQKNTIIQGIVNKTKGAISPIDIGFKTK